MALSYKQRLASLLAFWQDQQASLDNMNVGTVQTEYELDRARGSLHAYEIAIAIASGRPAPDPGTFTFIKQEYMKRLKEAEATLLNTPIDHLRKLAEWHGTCEAYRQILDDCESAVGGKLRSRWR